jgi:methylamine dehydrogenase accessory protein MauD
VTGALMFWTMYAVQWALLLVLSFAVFLLFRQHGRNLITSSSHRADQGPSIGSQLPVVTLPSAEGSSVTIGGRPIPSLVFVVGPRCPACLAGIDVLNRIPVTRDVETVIVCTGTPEQCRDFWRNVPEHLIRVVDATHLTTARWRVASTPFLLAIDKKGLVRGKASSADPNAFESLRQTLADQEGSSTGAFAIRESASAVVNPFTTLTTERRRKTHASHS